MTFPTVSPMGRNTALDTLVADVESGKAKLNEATAKQAMALVAKDKVVAVEETEALKRLDKATWTARPGVNGATAWGIAVNSAFATTCDHRLFAWQVNSTSGSASSMMNVWLQATGFGAWSQPAPSYIKLSQENSPYHPEAVAPDVRTAAFAQAADEVAGQAKLDKLLERFPAAVVDPGHTEVLPTLAPGVQAEYDALMKDLRRGIVANERDPLAPLRKYLTQRYT